MTVVDENSPLLANNSNDGSLLNNFSGFFCFISLDYIFINNDGKPITINNDIVSSVFLLLNIMLGTGILFQGYVVSQSGILLTIAAFIIVSIVSYYSCIILLEAATHLDCYSFGTLCRRCNGEWALWFLEWSIVCGILLETIVYFILIGDMLASFFDHTSISSWYTNNNFWLALISICVVLPLCLIRSVGHMTSYAYYSQTVVIALVITVIVLAIIALAKGDSVFEQSQSELNYGSFNGFIRTVGNILFSVTCSFGYLHVEKAMAVRHNTKLVKQVTMYTVVIGAIFLFVTGLAGYIAFGNDNKVNLIDSLGQGILGDVFKVLFTMHLAMYIPAEFAIMRASLTNIFGIEVEKEENVEYILVTVGSMLIVIAATVTLNILAPPDVYQSLVNVIGGICGVVQMCFSPALISLAVFRKQQHHFIGAISLLVVGLLIAVAVIAGEIVSY